MEEDKECKEEVSEESEKLEESAKQKKKFALTSLFKWKKEDGSTNNSALLFDGLGVFVVLYFFLTGSTSNLKFDTFAPFKEEVEAYVVDISQGIDKDGKVEYYTEVEFEYNGRVRTAINNSYDYPEVLIGERVLTVVNAMNLKEALKVESYD